MIRCSACGVDIAGAAEKCPLCGVAVASADPSPDLGFPEFHLQKRRMGPLIRLISLAVVLVTAVQVLVNLLTWNGVLWSVISCTDLLYAWFMGLFTFNRNIHIGFKMLMHAVTIPLLLIVINFFAYDIETIDRVEWAAAYAMPAIFLGFIVAINIIMVTRRKNHRHYLLYQFTLCIAAFVPLILVFAGAVDPCWPSITTTSASALTVAAWSIFARKSVKSEFGRKFHV